MSVSPTGFVAISFFALSWGNFRRCYEQSALPEEFTIQAVNQVTEKELPVADVSLRLGVLTHSLYA